MGRQELTIECIPPIRMGNWPTIFKRISNNKFMKLEVEVFLAATHVKNRRFSDLKKYYGRSRTSSLRSDEISMLLSFTSKTTNESRRQ